MSLTVDITTRARVWLECWSYPLPDPWTTGDVVSGIQTLYPGGRRQFLKDVGVYPAVKRRQRQQIAKSIARTPDGTFTQQKEVHP